MIPCIGLDHVWSWESHLILSAFAQDVGTDGVPRKDREISEPTDGANHPWEVERSAVWSVPGAWHKRSRRRSAGGPKQASGCLRPGVA